MAKAVLVMDMPESCFGCNFCHVSSDGEDSCQALEVVKPVDSETYEKPDWCPLRELPKHKRTIGAVDEGKKLLLNAGWNDCLDKILERNK